MTRVIHTNSDPSITDEAFEEAADLIEEDDAQMHRDLATETLYDTQHGDGHTYNPHEAQEQGLVYTPPSDPPVLPGEDLQGAEMAAGFSQSMEASSPEDEILPPSTGDDDLELQNDVYSAIRNNSETMHLTNVAVRARAGVVTLLGTVPTDSDIGLVDELVADLEGVDEVRNRLEVDV